MKHRIVFNPHSGGVAVTVPSALAVWFLMHGGRWPEASAGWLDQQIERQAAAGISRDVATRYVRAMQSGGLCELEAISLIADRDCAPFGTAVEIVDASEIPDDRTYRMAWRRSSNGGPIIIDEDIARAIDEQRMWHAYENSTG